MTIADLKRLSEEDARTLIEGIIWPHGPACPHCGNVDQARIGKVKANPEKRVRAGLYQCKDCRKQFTVTRGTILEGSHLPMATWVYLIAAMCNAKKGASARQLQRELRTMNEEGNYGNFTSIWYACHRIRLAMSHTGVPSLLGGKGKVLEADETWVGGKPRYNPKTGKAEMRPKSIVLTLLERGGGARSTVVRDVNAFNLRGHLTKHGNPASKLMTDEQKGYRWPGKLFISHETVNHSQKQYARGEVFSNTAEGFFSMLKRSIYGTHHQYSHHHLPRYLAERDLVWSTRKISDVDRVKLVIGQTQGKRLYYKKPKSVPQHYGGFLMADPDQAPEEAAS